MRHQEPHIIVMGVSACGKSSVAEKLAAALNRPFLEGDDFHPRLNIQKMNDGVALQDDDRWIWLQRIADDLQCRSGPVVATCSVLKRVYRDVLRKGAGRNIFFLHLTAPRDVLKARMMARKRHFMPLSLLDSQLSILERLSQGELGAAVDVTPSLNVVIGNSLAAYRRVLS